MTARTGPVGPRPQLFLRVVLGIAIPLGIVSVAYSLWWISDRLLYIGPLDRAAFGWAVVIPVWVAAPVAAGFAWRGLTSGARLLAAGISGSIISFAAALLFWQAVAFPVCQFGGVRMPGEWIAPSLIVGGMIGGGLVGSGLFASTLVRQGHPWRAVVIGATMEMIMVFVAILVTGAVLMVPACQRPSI